MATNRKGRLGPNGKHYTNRDMSGSNTQDNTGIKTKNNEEVKELEEARARELAENVLKDIEECNQTSQEFSSIKDIMPSGKHLGLSFESIAQRDPEYLKIYILKSTQMNDGLKRRLGEVLNISMSKSKSGRIK